MTAPRITSTAPPVGDDAEDLLLTAPDALEAARGYVADAALSASPGGRVGLELEFHLVDLAHPEHRPSWPVVQALAADVGPMPAGSSVTLEPGGQIELSTPPGADVLVAVAALRQDRAALSRRLAEEGLGSVPLGTDLARPVARVNPGARYRAMEQHFDALGCAGSGRAMMSATAALQVNLDAGPTGAWDERMSLVRSLVPVLVALSSTSPYLGGRSSGWHSMRQGIWQGIDHGRSDPVPGGEPTDAWAHYALEAPVMLVRSGDQLQAVTGRVSFAHWLRNPTVLGRPATTHDLDYHLTTLFPPVRPRGYLEIRCVDAMPDRWWPAMAAVTATLMDDPVAADTAADLCAPVAASWESAARAGLRDPDVRTAVVGCLDAALRHCPPGIVAEVEGLAELIASGRTPSGELRARIESTSPLEVMVEEAHA